MITEGQLRALPDISALRAGRAQLASRAACQVAAAASGRGIAGSGKEASGRAPPAGCIAR